MGLRRSMRSRMLRSSGRLPIHASKLMWSAAGRHAVGGWGRHATRIVKGWVRGAGGGGGGRGGAGRGAGARPCATRGTKPAGRRRRRIKVGPSGRVPGGIAHRGGAGAEGTGALCCVRGEPPRPTRWFRRVLRSPSPTRVGGVELVPGQVARERQQHVVSLQVLQAHGHDGGTLLLAVLLQHARPIGGDGLPQVLRVEGKAGRAGSWAWCPRPAPTRHDDCPTLWKVSWGGDRCKSTTLRSAGRPTATRTGRPHAANEAQAAGMHGGGRALVLLAPDRRRTHLHC